MPQLSNPHLFILIPTMHPHLTPLHPAPSHPFPPHPAIPPRQIQLAEARAEELARAQAAQRLAERMKAERRLAEQREAQRRLPPKRTCVTPPQAPSPPNLEFTTHALFKIIRVQAHARGHVARQRRALAMDAERTMHAIEVIRKAFQKRRLRRQQTHEHMHAVSHAAAAQAEKVTPPLSRGYGKSGGKFLRIFLSSTFRDMSRERELLLKR